MTCKVHLYQHDNFEGLSKTYSKGSFSSIWRNDDVSSIKVSGTGCTATVYEHSYYKGWKVTLTAGSYTLSSLKARGFKNDAMSSMKVTQSIGRRRSEELEPIEGLLAGNSTRSSEELEPIEGLLAGNSTR